MSWCKAMVAGVAAIAMPLVATGSTVDLSLTLNGTQVISESRSGSSLSLSSSRTVNNSGGSLQGIALSTGEARSKVNVFGTQPANGAVTVTTNPVLMLTPPSGASFGSGKLVLNVQASAGLAGTGTLTVGMNAQASTPLWSVNGSNSQQVANQPGEDSIAFAVTLQLPQNLDPTWEIEVLPTLTLQSTAAITGGGAQTSEVNVTSAKIVSFAVLDGGGAQVTGFTLTGYPNVNIAEVVPPPSTIAVAIEYYNAAFQHYFVTSLADEITKLDNGTIKGWQRTGESFNVYTTPTDRNAVCRFFSTAFGAKSSHFYAPRGLGCEAVFADHAWEFEGDVFYTYLPDAATGACPHGNIPVFRVYNNGQGGAPNHRFTTSEATRAEMIAEGWIPEGRGIGVGWCAPQ